MRALFWLIFIFNFFQSGFTQEALTLDSLRRELRQQNTDEGRMPLYNQISFAFWNTNPDSTIIYAERAEQLASLLDNRYELCRSLGNRANGLTSLGKFDAAFSLYEQAIGIAEAIGAQDLLAELKVNLAGVYYRLGNLRVALRFSVESRELARQINNSSAYISSSTLVGSLYADFENYGEAIRVLSDLLRYMAQIGAPDEIGYPLFNLGNAYFAQHMGDSSRYYYQRAVLLARDQQDYYLLEIASYRLAETLANERQPDLGQAVIDSLYLMPGFRSFPETEIERALTLVELAMAKRDFRKACVLAWAGKTVAERKDAYALSDFYTALSRIYEITGDRDSAFFYLKNAVDRRDSIRREVRASELGYWQLDNQLRAQEQREAQLTSRLERERARTERMNLLLMVAGAGILIGIFVIVYVMRLARQKEKLNQDLEGRNADLQVSMREIKRLDRELHNMMMQIVHDLRSPLNSVYAALQLIKRGGTEVEKLMDMAAIEVQRGQAFIGSLLKSVKLGKWQVEVSEIDLVPFMNAIVARHRTRSSLKHIGIDLVADSVRILSDRVAIDRIIDNLISNAVKYAPVSTRISVRAHVDRELVLRVVDQGPGFTADDQQQMFGSFQRLSAVPENNEDSYGIGLSSVYALVNALGGTVHLATEPGQGADFEIRIPVRIVG